MWQSCSRLCKAPPDRSQVLCTFSTSIECICSCCSYAIAEYYVRHIWDDPRMEYSERHSCNLKQQLEARYRQMRSALRLCHACWCLSSNPNHKGLWALWVDSVMIPALQVLDLDGKVVLLQQLLQPHTCLAEIHSHSSLLTAAGCVGPRPTLSTIAQAR